MIAGVAEPPKLPLNFTPFIPRIVAGRDHDSASRALLFHGVGNRAWVCSRWRVDRMLLQRLLRPQSERAARASIEPTNTPLSGFSYFST